MKDKKRLNEIYKFIQKTATEQAQGIKEIEEIRKIQKEIDKYICDESTLNFTFTIGEINAYMG